MLKTETCPASISVGKKSIRLSSRRCGKPLLEGSGRCVFHDSNAWKKHVGLIEKEVKKKIEEGDLNFYGCHLPEIDFSKIAIEFEGPIDFRKTVFHGKTVFNNVIFSDTVDFRGAVFNGETWFAGVQFSKGASFGGARFLGKTIFSGAEFWGKTWFGHVKFSETAMFNDAQFVDLAWFAHAEFVEEASFTQVKFSGRIVFTHVKFMRNALFAGSEFSDATLFVRTEFWEVASFRNIEFIGYASFSGARFSEKARIDFSFSRFYRLVRFGELPMSRFRMIFKNTLFERGLDVDELAWSKNGFRLSIEESDLASAAVSYQALKEGFENMGRQRIAGELFYREMVCRQNMIHIVEMVNGPDSAKLPHRLKRLVQILLKNRLLRCIFQGIESLCRIRITLRNLGDWVWMRLFDVTCGFGERPTRIVRGSMFIVLVYTALYFPIISSTSIIEQFKTALFLSLGTFTSAKLQNIPLASPWEWLTITETVLGWFMLSLFLVVFTRKMSRA